MAPQLGCNMDVTGGWQGWQGRRRRRKNSCGWVNQSNVEQEVVADRKTTQKDERDWLEIVEFEIIILEIFYALAMSMLIVNIMAMSLMMKSRLQSEVSKLTNDGAFNLEPNVGRLQCRQMIIHQDAVGNKNYLYDNHTWYLLEYKMLTVYPCTKNKLSNFYFAVKFSYLRIWWACEILKGKWCSSEGVRREGKNNEKE